MARQWRDANGHVSDAPIPVGDASKAWGANADSGLISGWDAPASSSATAAGQAPQAHDVQESSPSDVPKKEATPQTMLAAALAAAEKADDREKAVAAALQVVEQMQSQSLEPGQDAETLLEELMRTTLATSAGASSSKPSTKPAGKDRADLLFEDSDEETSAADAVVEAKPCGTAEADDEDEEDEDSDEDIIAVKRLQELLLDSALFHEVCENAVNTVGTISASGPRELRSAEDLQKAINIILNRCGVEEMDEEEALDLYDEPMQGSVFYQLAHEYFKSFVRTVLMNV